MLQHGVAATWYLKHDNSHGQLSLFIFFIACPIFLIYHVLNASRDTALQWTIVKETCYLYEGSITEEVMYVNGKVL